MNEQYLQHHGVLGMHWGIRRYQPYGKGEKVSGGKEVGAATKVKQRDDAKNKVVDGIKKVKKSDTEKSGIIAKHKQKLVNGYLEKGYSKEAAELAANNRIKTEAVLLVAGAVVLTSAEFYAYRKIGQQYCDKVFKAGHTIQNIGASSKNVNPFYASVNKRDKNIYKNFFSLEKLLLEKNEGIKKPTIYKHDIKLNKDIKRASIANSRKIFLNKFNTDPEFKSAITDKFVMGTRYEYNPSKKNGKELYDRFNKSLATPRIQKSGLHLDFYKELQKNGYNAILDIEDTKYTPYKHIVKEPTIFFGDGFDRVKSTSLKESDIYTNAGRQLVYEGMKLVGKTSVAATGALSLKNTKLVNKYLEEHPNSKLSRKEILKIVKSQK